MTETKSMQEVRKWKKTVSTKLMKMNSKEREKHFTTQGKVSLRKYKLKSLPLQTVKH